MKASSPFHGPDRSAGQITKVFGQFLELRHYSVNPVFGPFQFSGEPASDLASGQPARYADENRAEFGGPIRGDLNPVVGAHI